MLENKSESGHDTKIHKINGAAASSRPLRCARRGTGTVLARGDARPPLYGREDAAAPELLPEVKSHPRGIRRIEPVAGLV